MINNESEFHKLRAGDVLVCPVTPPVWSVLFPSVAALVTDTGGTLLHPSIIARGSDPGRRRHPECDRGAARRQAVVVDGTAGTVRIEP